MDLRKLKKLIDLVEESGIAEIEVTEGEEKVRITRSVAAPAVQTVYAAAPAPVAAPANGAMAVGWLCVSTFMMMCVFSVWKPCA